MTDGFVVERTASGLIVLRRLSLGPGPRPAVFFDRDGVLNIDKGYVGRWADFEWRPGAVRSVELAHESGFWAVVVTNQSGVGRGLFPESGVLDILTRMMGAAPFDVICACPHGPDAMCPCRKPSPFMLETADRVLGVEKERSFLLGDMERDIEAAVNFGIPGHLVDARPLDELTEALLSGSGTA